jgi:hypothetical protein
MIVIYDLNDSNQFYKTIFTANLALARIINHAPNWSLPYVCKTFIVNATDLKPINGLVIAKSHSTKAKKEPYFFSLCLIFSAKNCAFPLSPPVTESEASAIKLFALAFDSSAYFVQLGFNWVTDKEYSSILIYFSQVKGILLIHKENVWLKLNEITQKALWRN